MVKNRNLILLSFLILFFILSALVPVSFVSKGPLHIALEVLKGSLITLGWFSLYFLIKFSFLARYKSLYKRDVPRLLLISIKFLIFSGAFLSIVVFVLGQSVFSIFALGGLLSAGLTFALGELILDAFAGVILETEDPFALNDWIKTGEGEEGRVIKINWRTVVLQTLDDYLIIVPHRKMAQGFINYSRPERSYWDSIEIVLDQTIPVERGERVLRAGVMTVPSLYHKKCDVTAMSVSEVGVTYEVRYMVPDLSICREVKHDVIEAVTRHLHAYGLKVSETLGEYIITQGGKPFEEEAPLTVEHLIKKVDFLRKLPQSKINQLAEDVQHHVYAEGEKIVLEGAEGQSMFLIGEGMVEVSIAYTNNAGQKREKKLFRLGYPEYFGEMALLLNEKRSATVSAVMNTVVYEISQDLLKETLKDNPEAFEKLAKEAKEKKEKNKLTKAEMEKLKDKKVQKSKGLLANFKKFFK